jgi:hypothetical protein
LSPTGDAFDADLVARDGEVTHVVRGHRAGASAQRDPTYGLEVERVVWGLTGALSVRMNVAERVPEAAGEKSIETLQLVPARTQLPFSGRSGRRRPNTPGGGRA